MAKFQPGVSGNPAGRPLGSKNKITLMKEAAELSLREHQGDERLKAVLDKAYEMALDGDVSMIKLVLEFNMSKGTTQDKSHAAEKVQINVNGPSEVKKETTVPLDEVALLVATNEETK